MKEEDFRELVDLLAEGACTPTEIENMLQEYADQEKAEYKRILEKCERTFESVGRIITLLQHAEPDQLESLVEQIDIDTDHIRAVIKDTIL